MNTLRYVLVLVLGIALPYAVQRWDRGRLSPRIRDGAWNAVTWASALYGFGPLSMMPWLWVTRHDFWTWLRRDGVLVTFFKSVALLLAGLVASAVLFAVVGALVGALVGAPD